MFAAYKITDLRSELWKRGLDPNGTRMELIRRLEEYEAAQRKVKRKDVTAALAIFSCVAVRLGDIGFSAYIASYFYTSLTDATFRLSVTVAFLGLASLASGIISYYRQRYYELKHNPWLSFFLGLCHMQLLVEWWDGVQDGKKTDALKLLLNVGAVMNSVPLGFYFSYLGYFTQWTYPLAIAVWLAMMSMGLTIISAEKEIYIQRGLGKLPILSPYSIVLFLFRCVELPARVFSYTLFAARFKGYVFIVTGIDIVVLYLIRASSLKRMQLKRDRSREALNRSLAALNKNGEVDVATLAVTEEEKDNLEFNWKWTIFHFLAWQLVYLEGIDAVPFFCLRILEISGMTALFLLLDGGVTSLDQFQTSGMVVCAGFCAAYCMLSPLWQYYRSHASFLHPTFRQPTNLQLKVMEALVQRPLGGDAEDAEDGVRVVADQETDDQKENREKSGISEHSENSQPDTAANNRPTVEEPEEEESSDDEESEEEEEPPEPVVIVKEVAPPPKPMKTIDTQYNWDEHFLDPEIGATPQGSSSNLTVAPITYKEKENCRACTTNQPATNTCVLQ